MAGKNNSAFGMPTLERLECKRIFQRPQGQSSIFRLKRCLVDVFVVPQPWRLEEKECTCV